MLLGTLGAGALSWCWLSPFDASGCAGVGRRRPRRVRIGERGQTSGQASTTRTILSHVVVGARDAPRITLRLGALRPSRCSCRGQRRTCMASGPHASRAPGPRVRLVLAPCERGPPRRRWRTDTAPPEFGREIGVAVFRSMRLSRQWPDVGRPHRRTAPDVRRPSGWGELNRRERRTGSERGAHDSGLIVCAGVSDARFTTPRGPSRAPIRPRRSVGGRRRCTTRAERGHGGQRHTRTAAERGSSPKRTRPAGGRDGAVHRDEPYRGASRRAPTTWRGRSRVVTLDQMLTTFADSYAAEGGDEPNASSRARSFERERPTPR